MQLSAATYCFETKGEKFSWENNIFVNLVVDKEEKKFYPDIPEEIPKVLLEGCINSGAEAFNFKNNTGFLLKCFI